MFEVDLPTAVAVEAERIAVQLPMDRVPAVPSPDTQAEAVSTLETDVQAVDVNSLELVRPRSMGVAHPGASQLVSQLAISTLLIVVGGGIYFNAIWVTYVHLPLVAFRVLGR